MLALLISGAAVGGLGGCDLAHEGDVGTATMGDTGDEPWCGASPEKGDAVGFAAVIGPPDSLAPLDQVFEDQDEDGSVDHASFDLRVQEEGLRGVCSVCVSCGGGKSKCCTVTGDALSCSGTKGAGVNCLATKSCPLDQEHCPSDTKKEKRC